MPWIRPYERSDGTPVRGHSRWAPGARREMTIFAVFALAVVGLGNGHASADGEGGKTGPGPRPTVHYPIRFDTTPMVKQRPHPTPTVSYPIRWTR
jgi:hypothetical protein